MQESPLPLDLFNRESPTFAGSIASPAVGPTVIAVNDVDIPCRAEFYTKDMVGANFLITQIVDPGFSKVPYANVNNKTVMGDRPKPLAEFLKTEEQDGRQSISKSKLRCYAYLIKKGKQKDKGPRIDGSDSNINDGVPVSYNIETGMVLRCMMKKAGAIGGTDREKRESFFPQDLDVIPAFSRVVIKLACKGWDKYKEGDLDANGEEVQTRDLNPCYRGYSCGIVEVRMAPGTIYSDRQSLREILPETPEEMRTIQCNFSEQNFPLRQSFQTESVPFLVKTTRKDAYCVHDPENDVFKIMDWGECGGGAIDVPGMTMRRALNSPLADDANRLMDVALAAQVVSFVCYINEYRGRASTNLSRVTGGPIIDTQRLLASIDVSVINKGPTEQAFLFPTDFMIGDPNCPTPITIAVWACPEAILEGELPDTPDLQLISHGVQAEKAYPISFQGPEGVDIWKGFFNVSRPSMNPRGSGANMVANAEAAVKFTRRKWDAHASAQPQQQGDPIKRQKKSAQKQ